MIQRLAILILSIAAFGVSAAAYDNLSYALNQEVMVKDLRSHCEIDQHVSDAEIKKVFLNSKENHTLLSQAAAALKSGKKEDYRAMIGNIHCPSLQQR